MTEPPPIGPTSLDHLEAYVAEPRIQRTLRPWSMEELVMLLDPAIPVTAIMDQLGVKRAVVTYELVRLRWTGFPVPNRNVGGERSPRSLAIEENLRAGMSDADVDRRHGATPARVHEIQNRANIPPRFWTWTEAERATLIAH